MRNRKMKSKKSRINAKGITLIALVITIIVLLILAGVSIATLTGENGILTRAQEAKTKTEEAEDIEKIRLAMSEAQIGENRYQELDATNFQEALNSQFEGRNIQLSDNGDGSYTISLDNNSKMFYADSDGQIISNENMIEIGTAEELKAFRDEVNSGNTYEGKYVYLTNDISLDINEEWTPIGIYLNDVTTPDDERNKPFKGIFDGGNYEINGIYINTTNKVQGLFGLINNGKIMNIIIGENCNITGGIATAGVVGYVCNNSIVNNCSNSSNINAEMGGGIVGYSNKSIIINNHNLGSVEGKEMTGGVVGGCQDSTSILKCYNTGNVSGSLQQIGGIAGRIIGNSEINQCYNNGNVNGKTWTGGICGLVQDNSKIISCFNLNTIVGQSDNVGGVSGKIDNASIEDCYNIGTIEGREDSIGGIVGHSQYGTIKKCYNIGNVIGTNAIEIGGVLGKITSQSSNNNNYYLTGCVSNSNILEGIRECTETELKSLTLDLGDAFKEDANNINNGYPILKWQ